MKNDFFCRKQLCWGLRVEGRQGRRDSHFLFKCTPAQTKRRGAHNHLANNSEYKSAYNSCSGNILLVRLEFPVCLSLLPVSWWLLSGPSMTITEMRHRCLSFALDLITHLYLLVSFLSLPLQTSLNHAPLATTANHKNTTLAGFSQRGSHMFHSRFL